MTDIDNQWSFAADANEIEEEEITLAEINNRPVALCKFEEAIYAFDNICSHEDACLSDGIVTGDEVECPLHGARFCIRTGEYLCAPATVDIDIFPVKQVGESVYVLVELP